MKSKILKLIISLILICGTASGSILVLDSFNLIDLGAKTDLTFTCEDVTYEYTGYQINPNSNGTIPFTVSGTIPEGHTYEVKYIGSQTNVGRYSWSLDITMRNQSLKDVTNDYNITVVPANLTITKKALSLKVKDATFEYDGEFHNSSEYQITSGYLCDGHRVVPTVIGESKDIGVVGQTASFNIADSSGTNVTSNYKISVVQGNIEIIKRDITILPSITSKVYDGKAITPGQANITSGSLISGHYAVLVYDELIKDVGVYTLGMNINIYDSQNNNMNDYYDISETSKSVEVEITGQTKYIQLPELTKEYDGESFETAINNWCANVNLPYGYTISASNDLFNYVEVDDKYILTEDDFTIEAPDEDTYKFVFINGYIQINERELSIKIDDLNFYPDGLNHFNAIDLENITYTTLNGSLVSGHSIKFGVTGTSTKVVGEIDQEVYIINIVDGNNKDVTSNYLLDDVTQGNYKIVTIDLSLSLKKDSYEYTGNGIQILELVDNNQKLLDGHVAYILLQNPVSSIGSYNYNMGSNYIVKITDKNDDTNDYSSYYNIDSSINSISFKITKITKTIKLSDITINSKSIPANYFTKTYNNKTYGILITDFVSAINTKISNTQGLSDYSIKLKDSISNLKSVQTYELTNDDFEIVNTPSDQDKDIYNIVIDTKVDSTNLKMVISKRDIEINIPSKDFEYDGSDHKTDVNSITCNYYNDDNNKDEKIDSSDDFMGLCEGHILIKNVTGGSSKIGNVSQVVEIKICDDLANDESSNYNFIYNKGEVKIVKRTITINNNYSCEYTGSQISSYEILKDSSLITSGSLLEGHKIVVSIKNPKKDINTYNDLECTIDVLDGSNKSVKDSYDISVSKINLTIGKIKLDCSNEFEYEYDEITSYGDIVVSCDKLLSGHTLKINITNSKQNKGLYNLNDLTDYSIIIKDSDNNHVTSLYDTSCINTIKLTIKQKEVKLSLGDFFNQEDFKMSYSGNDFSTSLNLLKTKIEESINNNYSSSYTVTINSETKSIWTVGEYELKSSDFEFSCTDDTKDNYVFSIDCETGGPYKLIINKAILTINMTAKDFTYDGNVHTSTDCTTTGLKNNDSVVIKAEGNSKNVGDITQDLTVSVISTSKIDVTDQYNITVNKATCKIVKKNISINLPKIIKKSNTIAENDIYNLIPIIDGIVLDSNNQSDDWRNYLELSFSGYNGTIKNTFQSYSASATSTNYNVTFNTDNAKVMFYTEQTINLTFNDTIERDYTGNKFELTESDYEVSGLLTGHKFIIDSYTINADVDTDVLNNGDLYFSESTTISNIVWHVINTTDNSDITKIYKANSLDGVIGDISYTEANLTITVSPIVLNSTLIGKFDDDLLDPTDYIVSNVIVNGLLTQDTISSNESSYSCTVSYEPEYDDEDISNITFSDLYTDTGYNISIKDSELVIYKTINNNKIDVSSCYNITYYDGTMTYVE